MLTPTTLLRGLVVHTFRYRLLLAGLGDMGRLRGATVYTGGLDTSSRTTDGEWALFWKGGATQAVFHVATLMTGPRRGR